MKNLQIICLKKPAMQIAEEKLQELSPGEINSTGEPGQGEPFMNNDQ